MMKLLLTMTSMMMLKLAQKNDEIINRKRQHKQTNKQTKKATLKMRREEE